MSYPLAGPERSQQTATDDGGDYCLLVMRWTNPTRRHRDEMTLHATINFDSRVDVGDEAVVEFRFEETLGLTAFDNDAAQRGAIPRALPEDSQP